MTDAPIRTRLREDILWRVLAAIYTLLIVATSSFWAPDDLLLRVFAIAGACAIVLTRRERQTTAGRFARILDSWPARLLLVAVLVYVIHTMLEVQEMLWTGIFVMGTDLIVIGFIGVALIIELVRRAFGPPLAIVSLLALAYALTGEHWPSFMAHAGVDAEALVRTTWYSFDGVFGQPTSVVTGTVLIFMVFGALLQATGTDRFLLKFARAVTGGIRGGPAHAAIVASALFGTISGSVTANVVGTGVFTIPTIRKQGFSKNFAGAVEASASSGGQFTPPVMAAAAFVMADLTGVPYLTICVIAALPALLFYVGIFSQVYVESLRLGIQAVPPAEREKLTLDDWLRSAKFFIPMLTIIGVMMLGRSPAQAGVGGIAAILLLYGAEVVIDWWRGAAPGIFRRAGRSIVEGVIDGGYQSAIIMIAVGAVGVVLGVVNETGIGFRFTSAIAATLKDSVLLGLMTAMVASLLLGMGLPTLPAYMLVVLLIGPGITKLGAENALVHLFVLYFAVLSAVTPPVAIGAYAAAAVAGGSPLATAVIASRLCIAGFLMPYLVVFYPQLSLVYGFDGSGAGVLALVLIVARLLLGFWLLATAMSGHARHGPLDPVQRGLRFVSAFGVLVLDPWVATGFVLLAVALMAIPRLLGANTQKTWEGTP